MAKGAKIKPKAVGLLQILGEDGSFDEGLEPKLPEEELRKLYYLMVLTRTFDERCLKLQRQGRMGTYAPAAGQEAAQVGSAYALKESDWLFPAFREQGALITRGLPLKNLLLIWMGNEEGNRIPEGLNIFTIAIPVATQIPHAVGAAWAAKLKGDEVAVLVYFSDGATSVGDFHEAANFAGVFQTPTVFFCQNNQYAISLPRSRQTAAETLAQKAYAYGFEGIQIDGNDLLAVYKATKEALDKARSGGGPTMIEAVTYRYGPHTTSDDPRRYRKDEEVEEWKAKRDPLKRFRLYLEKKGLWDEQAEAQAWEKAAAEVAQAVEEAEAAPQRDVADIFKYVYAEMPQNLQEQLEELRHFLEKSRLENKE